MLEQNPEYVSELVRWRSNIANKNYNAGRRFEWKRRDHWKKMGHDVLRTAGSHGPFDLVTIGKGGDIQLIQCKIVTTKKEADRLLKGFKENPPLGHRPYARYHQVMEIYVKELKEVISTSI